MRCKIVGLVALIELTTLSGCILEPTKYDSNAVYMQEQGQRYTTPVPNFELHEKNLREYQEKREEKSAEEYK